MPELKPGADDVESMLEIIAALSREFGGEEYVLGGGGNSSAKTAQKLWVKPSGSAMRELAPASFVMMDRARLGELYAVAPPTEADAREALVKTMMERATEPGAPGRASVEAPLHDSLDARFVVHTHPALVNGMTCGREGRAACGRLFPEALWIEYVDPGYTLCMHVRAQVAEYAARHGRQPSLIFLKNHGVFVAGESAEAVRALYAEMMGRLRAEYARAGVEDIAGSAPAAPVAGTLAEGVAGLLGEGEPVCCVTGEPFEPAAGALTPDHIVYAGSFACSGKPTAAAIEAYRARHGRAPKVFAWDAGVCAVGATHKKAALALTLARDGARVRRLAGAFGGVEYLDEASRHFIENWEVEVYRSRQV